MISRGASAFLAGILLAACGQASSGPSASPKSTPKPTPTPTAAPETMTVSILTTGVGAWQLLAIPVAILHNDAQRHGAEEVVVHFATHAPGGGALGTLDSPPVNLAPGETIPVAADCTDGCNGAASTDATLSVGTWTPTIGATLSAATAMYQCETGACSGGRAEGQATSTLSASGVGLAANAPIAAFAACTDGGGTIVGAGVTQTSWTGGSSNPVNVPVIVNSPPASCQVGASTGW